MSWVITPPVRLLETWSVGVIYPGDTERCLDSRALFKVRNTLRPRSAAREAESQPAWAWPPVSWLLFTPGLASLWERLILVKGMKKVFLPPRSQ